MTNEEIRRALETAAEPEYRAFSARLLPPDTPLLGVRLPVIRRMARRLAAGDWRAYLDAARSDTFEERMLQGMTLGFARAGIAEKTPYVLRFLPRVNNWSLCDSFCAALKAAKEEPEATLTLIDSLIGARDAYTARFAVVQLLMYYTGRDALEGMLARLERVVAPEDAAQTAVAWALSIAYKTDPGRVLAFAGACALPVETKRRAYQKMTELTCVNAREKAMLRARRDACRSIERN